MSIPVTDAFDNDASFESITLQLRPEQIQWLRDQAASSEHSLDHVLRALVDQHMNHEGGPTDRSSGRVASANSAADRAAREHSGSIPSQQEASEQGAPEDETKKQSVVESLRSTSERLERLTQKSEENRVPNPLERLKERIGGKKNTSEDASPHHVAPSTATPSQMSAADVMPSDVSVATFKASTPPDSDPQPESGPDAQDASSSSGTGRQDAAEAPSGSDQSSASEADGDQREADEQEKSTGDTQSMFDMMD